MRPSATAHELLQQLAETPLLDRLELAALSGWSRAAVYRQVERLEQDGLVESLTHASELTAATRRYCLSAAGVQTLAHLQGRSAAELLRAEPVSQQWRGRITERLDAAAVLYRLASTIADADWPIRYRWFRARPMDAVVTLPDGRCAALVRIGQTSDRTAVAKRLGRLRDETGFGLVLLLLPDETRLRQARRLLSGMPAFSALAVERAVVNADQRDAVWWLPSGSARLSLQEALSYAAPSLAPLNEPPLASVTLPQRLRPDRMPCALSAQQKRTLDLIGDWVWLSRSDLADLLGVGQRRLTQLLGPLDGLGLIISRRYRGRTRLALSDRGLAVIARRDRAAVGLARSRWSTLPHDMGDPLTWRDVRGTRARQLLRHLDHTEAVHGFLARLSRQARGLDQAVAQLDPPHRASRYFRLHEQLRSIHPDAFVMLHTDHGPRAFFLEYERRADRPANMSDRLAPYLRYYATRRPLDHHGVIPQVLVVFEDELAVSHFLRLAQRQMSRDRVSLPLLASCAAEVARSGPLAPVWRSTDAHDLVAPL